jgi:hypothetical protein
MMQEYRSKEIYNEEPMRENIAFLKNNTKGK